MGLMNGLYNAQSAGITEGFPCVEVTSLKSTVIQTKKKERTIETPYTTNPKSMMQDMNSNILCSRVDCRVGPSAIPPPSQLYKPHIVTYQGSVIIYFECWFEN
ncbi:hypothetical protein P8452_27029 [Trifolium repens]|nr:hypothetical protein P8452_27029 [Trifolium repens]